MTDLQNLAPAAAPAAGANSASQQLRISLVTLGLAIDELAVHSAAVSSAPISDFGYALADFDQATASVSAAFDHLRSAVGVMAFPAAPQATAPIQAQVPAPPTPNGSFIRTAGPWIAGFLFGVIPPVPLASVSDNGGKWHAITRSKYIGLTQNSAISINAVTGVSTGLSEKFSTQADALDHFNGALATDSLALV
ncbi:hypothetical protein C8R46DRAFT_1238643 [Mycena filopes]|nr:hypothetical protein C8R46DRAFT_1238643 [Mycena filopes]